MRLLAKKIRNEVAGRTVWDEKARLLNRPDVSITNPEYLKLGKSVYINRNVEMVTPVEGNQPNTHIYLGKHTSIGRYTELCIGAGNKLHVGDYSSMNQGCVLIGDVTIERYCTLAYNVYMSSGNHYFDKRPTWLIKDQDHWFSSQPGNRKALNEPIQIDEDVWLGWGVFVKAGVHIGRGAIIGANAVVTKDVPPYTVWAGVPAKQIDVRFPFSPPKRLEAMDENHWPYFYKGFLMRQKEISFSKRHSSLLSQSQSCVLMGGKKLKKLQIMGHLTESVRRLELQVECNRKTAGTLSITNPTFNETINISPDCFNEEAKQNLPTLLRGHNEIRFTVLPKRSVDERESDFGIMSLNAITA